MTSRLLVLVALACVLLLGARGLALAHAGLRRSEPAAGSRLATAPARVRLVFTEPVEPTLARLTLESGNTSTTLVATGDPHNVNAVVAPLSALAPGSYVVSWRVVSVDGHSVAGRVPFAIGAGRATPPRGVASGAGSADKSGAHDSAASAGEHASDSASIASSERAPSGSTAPQPSRRASSVDASMLGAPVLAAMLRGLALGALMALTGLLGYLALPRPAGAPIARRATRIARQLALLSPVMLALHAAVWVRNTAPDHEITRAWSTLALSSGVGQVELWRVGLTVLALWALWLARRVPLALVFSLGALLLSGHTGHAVALRPVVATPAKALHLVAGAAWLGGVLWLVVHERDSGAAFVAESGRVSAVALGAAVAVAISGTVQAALFVASPAALVRSGYGLVLLLKVVGFAALCLFGAYYRRRVLPWLAERPTEPQRFRRMLWREVALMLAVVVLGGWLAYIPQPAPGAAAAAHPDNVPTEFT